MAELVHWSGDGLSPGTMTTASAGIGDTAPGSINGTAPSIVSSGLRPPRVAFPVDVASYVAWSHTGTTIAAWRWYQSCDDIGNGVQLAVTWTGILVPWQLNVTAAGALSLDDEIGIPVATSADGVFVAGTLYRIEVTYNAGALDGYLYDGIDGTEIAHITGAIASNTITEFWWGTVNAGTFGARQTDDLIVTDTATLIGPRAPAPADTGVVLPLTENLNRLAGTEGFASRRAANVWAGTSGLALQGALNIKAGTGGLAVNECLNILAGTEGLGRNEASSRIAS